VLTSTIFQTAPYPLFPVLFRKKVFYCKYLSDSFICFTFLFLAVSDEDAKKNPAEFDTPQGFLTEFYQADFRENLLFFSQKSM
jgi:hypothetical protein